MKRKFLRTGFLLFIGLVLAGMGTNLQSQEENNSAKPKRELNLSSIRPGRLTCEYLTDPLGIDVVKPRLGWSPVTDGEVLFDCGQTAYRIRVAPSEKELLAGENLLWDSNWVESPASSQIEYAGIPLQSDRAYYWNVQIRDNQGKESLPCRPARWSTGFLNREQWTAKWIGSADLFTWENDGANNPADPWFRKRFTLDDAPKSAFLHIASVGYHEIEVNGRRITDAVLAPNVSDHRHRARFVTYDITDALTKGENFITLWLGAGWGVFREYDAPDRPKTPIFMAQSNIKLKNGETFRLVSDETWKTAPSGNRMLGVWYFGHYGGEFQNGEFENSGWNRLGFNDSSWAQATVYTPNLTVSSQMSESNRVISSFTGTSVEETEPGVWRVDMGRNFAGWTEIEVKGDPGDVVEFQFSESPNSAMTFRLYSRYQIGPSGRGVFKNRFNYSSGRWITVKGLKERPSAGQFRGYLVRTGYERAASFECSDELQNWIYNTVLWTFENLSIGGYIVDCPQRERLGYGGDAHATSETGIWNYDLAAFYTKWMQDWRDVQGWSPKWMEDKTNIVPGREADAAAGTLPNTAPTYVGGGGPAWGGIVITLPWSLYKQYGDRRVLEDNFEMMKRWLAFLNAYTKDGLLYRYGDQWSFLGDWLWPGAPDGPNSDTEDSLCLNCIYRVFNLTTAEKIARVLGKTAEADEWKKLADEGRAAVHKKYFHAEDNAYFDGRMSIQSAALLAEIPPAELRAGVMKRLEDEILVKQKGHIGAGITGGSLLFKLLRQEGRDDLIWSMVSQTEYPGWGFMRANDATTIWEAWELNRPGHSLLHSSYLYPGAWYIDSVLGIRPSLDDPGFRKVVIHPPKASATPLEWAKGHFQAPTGKITVDWRKRSDGTFQLKTTLPPNTTGEIFVPSAGQLSVRTIPPRAVFLRDEPGYSVYEVPSGVYEFRSKP